MSKARIIISWVLAVLIALAFLASAAAKLTGVASPMFAHWGYPPWFATLYLNGTWKMNPTQSRFRDPEAAPTDVVLRFEQQGQTLHETLAVVNAAGKSTVSLDYAQTIGSNPWRKGRNETLPGKSFV